MNIINKTLRVGVISDINHDSSPAYSSYYYACKNLFENVFLIGGMEDLDKIDVLVCGNDHFQNHLKIWSNERFTEYCNQKSIPFFVHTVEHINTPIYPHNVGIQQKLERYKNLYQRCWDINDAKTKKRSVARVLLSKNFFNYKKTNEKKDGIIFIGKIYDNRKSLITELNKFIEVTVIERGQFNYFDFLSKLSEYKFILSPKSLLVNGIPGRFYESLWVESVPLQEIYEDTLDYYTIEKDMKNVIFFKTIDELINKLNNNTFDNITQPKMFLEDELLEFFKEFNLNF